MAAYRGGGWLKVTCRLTACRPGSAPGPILGNQYGKTLPLPFIFYLLHGASVRIENQLPGRFSRPNVQEMSFSLSSLVVSDHQLRQKCTRGPACKEDRPVTGFRLVQIRPEASRRFWKMRGQKPRRITQRRAFQTV